MGLSDLSCHEGMALLHVPDPARSDLYLKLTALFDDRKLFCGCDTGWSFAS